MTSLDNYSPMCYNDPEKFLKSFHKSLCALEGGTLTEYFLAWSPVDNIWQNNFPVILVVDKVQYEFTAFITDFGLTIDQIDVSATPGWYDPGLEIYLHWKNNCDNQLSNFLNRRIKAVYLLEYCEYVCRFSLVGIEIEFENQHNSSSNSLQILNAFDRIELVFFPFVEDLKSRKEIVECS